MQPETENIFAAAIVKVIEEQKVIIGPLAVELARGVDGLEVPDTQHVNLKKDGKQVLHDLVRVYSQLFGRASVEVCKDAITRVAPDLSSQELSEILN
jgi:hypothetical protein